MENIDFYLDNFISVIQVGSRERHQMLQHFFRQIKRFFRPNKEMDTKHKDPISLKKLG